MTSKPRDCRRIAVSFAERNSGRQGEGPDSVFRLFWGVLLVAHRAESFAAGAGRGTHARTAQVKATMSTRPGIRMSTQLGKIGVVDILLSVWGGFISPNVVWHMRPWSIRLVAGLAASLEVNKVGKDAHALMQLGRGVTA